MRLVIAGSRSFREYDVLCKEADEYIKSHKDKGEEVIAICGGATGADQLGELYAESRGYQIELFPAFWASEGRYAGYKRNVRMAKAATHVLLFWDGISRGTQHMLEQARRRGLYYKVVRF